MSAKFPREGANPFSAIRLIDHTICQEELQLNDVVKMVKTTFGKTTSLCYKRDPQLLTLRLMKL